jgi:hypothetical protein
MDTSSNQPAKKKRRVRKKTKVVVNTDTNRYKHFEIRSAFIGAFIQYIPQANEDIKRMGAENWYNACVQNGASLTPFTEPTLETKP